YAGVQLTGGMAADELKSYTATDLLNFAESVLVDTDLWNQVPDEFEDDQGIKTFNKEVVKKDLQDYFVCS
ncbi:MAG: hypothetical protein KKB19_09655, partial [Bacteroidetes bacterium]|nr:hypothetical protein [Bacteroidota bacterium]